MEQGWWTDVARLGQAESSGSELGADWDERWGVTGVRLKVRCVYISVM